MGKLLGNIIGRYDVGNFSSSRNPAGINLSHKTTENWVNKLI
jgi:hypothetical protein